MKSYGKSTVLVCIMLAISGTSLQAGNDQKLLNEKASQLYHDGQYEESLRMWYSLAETGNTDPNLYVNIGHAEAIQGHIPESILAFEQALRLCPGENEISEALKKQRGKIENAVIPVNPFFLLEWYRMGLGFLRPGSWVMSGLLILIFALFQWLVSIHAISRLIVFNGKGIWPCLAGGILFILIGFMAYSQLHRPDEAVVMVSCDCRQAPSDESPLMRLLNPGEKVRITDHIAEWNKVSLLNLDEGMDQTGLPQDH